MKSYLLILTLLLQVHLTFGQIAHFVASGEATIHYQTVGEGTPVLIINGGPGFNSNGFLPIAQKIAALGYQSILFDQRGTGQSTLPELSETTITMDLMAEDIEAIRKDLDLKDWIVFGHSFGGMLANYYASKYPTAISAMIQSASGGIDLAILGTTRTTIEARLTESELDSMNYWRQQFMQSNEAADRKKLNYYLAKAYVYHPEYRPIIAQRLMQGNMTLNRMVWQDMRRIGFDCKEKLKDFTPPVLIIQGVEDVVPKALADTAHSVYRNSKIVLLDKCGHYGWLDQEERYIKAIDNFLKNGIDAK